MPGFARTPAPASGPRPGTPFSAPSGRPAASARSAQASAARPAPSAGRHQQARPLTNAPPPPRPDRATAVISRPLPERQSPYFQAGLADQFDAFIWRDETHPVKPLGAPGSASHDDETYPFGI